MRHQELPTLPPIAQVMFTYAAFGGQIGGLGSNSSVKVSKKQRAAENIFLYNECVKILGQQACQNSTVPYGQLLYNALSK